MATQTNSKDISTFNILGVGTQMNGNLHCNGNLRIDGLFDGKLNVGGKLVVGKDSVITGEISCNSAEIEGKVTANISAKDAIALRNTAKVKGDITTDKISIENGVLFIGNCKMPDITE